MMRQRIIMMVGLVLPLLVQAADWRPNQQDMPSPVVLRAFLQARHARVGMHDFCLFGGGRGADEHGPAQRWVWMYWRQGRELHQLGDWAAGGPASPDETGKMLASEKAIHLWQDVRRSEAEIKGSTYLVTRAWVARQLNACVQKGRWRHVLLRKPARRAMRKA